MKASFLGPKKINLSTSGLLAWLWRSKARRQCIVSAFTLPELLIASSIGVVVALISGQFLVDQIFQGRRLEATQRVRENISRFNHLVQIEASEADEIKISSNAVSGCSGPAGSPVLIIPKPIGTYASSNESVVQYYNDLDNDGVPSIWRCGPPVSRNGVLKIAENNVSGVVLRNAQIQIGTGLNGTCPAATVDRVNYKIVPVIGSIGGNIGGLGDCTTAQARGIFVCNNVISGSGGEIGDCPS